MQLACYLFLGEMTWLLHQCHLVIFLSIGIGAGLAGPVLAGPHFWRFNEMVINIVKSACALCARLLQLDHFKSPSYAPA